MPVMKFSLGQVNIVDYLIVQLRKTTALGSVYASQTFAPPQPTTRDITFANIDSAVYQVEFRESPDGIALGSLLSTYIIDIKESIQVFERRFYTVDGPNSIDPASGQNILADPYLDGKKIGGVFQEGFRYLVDPVDKAGNPIVNKEYDLHTGGGIELLNGLQFSSPFQVWSIDVIFDQAVPSSNNAQGGFGPVEEITVNTLLTSAHYNRRIRCSGIGSRLLITMPLLTATPEGTAFLFMCNGGNQLQVKLQRSSTDLFLIHEFTPTELNFMKGESLTIEKRTINAVEYWEVYNQTATILQVLERLDAQWNAHPNTKPADGTLYDGDDWPRPWYWITNRLPLSHYIVDDTVVNGGYVHPVGKEGLYVIHSSLKKFRVPNTQGLYKKGLDNFTTFGGDATRKMGINPAYDFPGGVQEEQMLQHTHDGLEADNGPHGGASSAINSTPSRLLVNTTSGGHTTITGAKTGNVSAGLGGTKLNVHNWGYVDLIRF
jgi:hypothetical protein